MELCFIVFGLIHVSIVSIIFILTGFAKGASSLVLRFMLHVFDCHQVGLLSSMTHGSIRSKLASALGFQRIQFNKMYMNLGGDGRNIF